MLRSQYILTELHLLVILSNPLPKFNEFLSLVILFTTIFPFVLEKEKMCEKRNIINNMLFLEIFDNHVHWVRWIRFSELELCSSWQNRGRI